MQKSLKSVAQVAMSLLVLSVWTGGASTEACTDIVLKKANDIVVSGRTLDFDDELGSNICFSAAGTQVSDPGVKFTSSIYKPLTWTAKYDAVYVDAYNEPAYVDGMNSQGLSVGTLWHPETQPASSASVGKNAMANVTLVQYLVDNAANVDEAKKLVEGLSLLLSTYKGQPMVLHWIITDKGGRSTVLELKNGQPRFFDQAQQIGVLTNSPDYDKQIANLKHVNTPEGRTESLLPGDYRPMSRFVKASYLISHLPPVKSSDQGMNAALQILHNFDVPKGAQQSGSYTQWISVRDQSNLRYWILSADRPGAKEIDFKKLDFRKIAGKRIAVNSPASGDLVLNLAELSLNDRLR